MAEPHPEFARPVPVGAIPAGGREERLVASPAECAALAARFMIPAVEALEATIRLAPEPGGSIRATGRLTARVVQTCVVTLDPVTQEVDAPIELRFLPDEAALSEDPEGPDEIVFDHGVIDLGEAVAEQLSLALDPYPRTPGASLPEPEEAPAPEKPNPFAALARRGRTP